MLVWFLRFKIFVGVKLSKTVLLRRESFFKIIQLSTAAVLLIFFCHCIDTVYFEMRYIRNCYYYYYYYYFIIYSMMCFIFEGERETTWSWSCEEGRKQVPRGATIPQRQRTNYHPKGPHQERLCKSTRCIAIQSG